MNYGNCSCCHKVIKFQKLPLCEDCKEKYLHSVKTYIYDNGIKDAYEIHEATGVPVRVIEYFLNNDCLALSSSFSEEQLRKNLNEQERLKKLALLDALTDSFKDKVAVLEEPEYELQGEMHFLGKDKRR